MAKPVLFVTRRLPASIEALAARDFDARLTPSDVAIADLPARRGRRGRHPVLPGRRAGRGASSPPCPTR